MKKNVLIKSVFIAFAEDGTPGEVQIQRVERWADLPDGAVVEDKYLPTERVGHVKMSAEQRKLLKGFLGAAAEAQAQQLVEAQAQIEELIAAQAVGQDELTGAHARASEAETRVRELEETVQAHELAQVQAETHIQGLMAEGQRREVALAELTEEVERLRDPALGVGELN